MKVLFMGTPDFAEKSLDALIKSKFEVVGVVCNPDKPKGRGHKMMMCPVKELALKNDIPVFQPITLKNGELLDTLNTLKPDVICVAAYGKLLGEDVLSYPKFGCVNVHGSLLPKYRGAAPIQWSVINGDEETGVTTMLMNKGLDTGDMLLVEKTKILPEETSEELFERLADVGARLLIKTLNGLEKGEITPIKQNEEKSTYAPMIKKEMAMINWEDSSEKIYHLILGMNSWPMAYTYYNGEAVKIISATYTNENSGKNPGEIIGVKKGVGLSVACKSGVVIIKEAQFPNSKRMNIEDYLRGHSILAGQRFGKDMN